MTAIATLERRAEVRDNLLALLRADDQIVGIISADENIPTCIRLIIVVKHENDMPDVYARWRAKMDALLSVAYRSHLAVGPVYFRTRLLLRDFLLCDITVTSLTHLRGVPLPHQIIVDQSNGFLEQALTRKEPMDEYFTYSQIINTLWEPIFYGTLALKHNEIWRALHFLDILRERLVRLAGLRHGRDVADYQDIDTLPEMFLVQLRHTLPASNSPTAIRRALRMTITMLFGEAEVLDERFSVTIGQDMEKHFASFVEAFA